LLVHFFFLPFLALGLTSSGTASSGSATISGMGSFSSTTGGSST
jgi:hypothetical protein